MLMSGLVYKKYFINAELRLEYFKVFGVYIMSVIIHLQFAPCVYIA